jgi:hypothetical protein
MDKIQRGRGRCFTRPRRRIKPKSYSHRAIVWQTCRMNDATATLPHSPAPTTLPLREWLGVLVLSTDILRRHGAALAEEDRVAQREIMQEAGARLAAALTHGA